MINKKRIQSLAVLIALAGIGTASAAGMVTVIGKLTGIDGNVFRIETKNSVYLIKKKAVSEGQAAQLDRSQDTEVALTVPFEGIESVKPKPAAGSH